MSPNVWPKNAQMTISFMIVFLILQIFYVEITQQTVATAGQTCLHPPISSHQMSPTLLFTSNVSLGESRGGRKRGKVTCLGCWPRRTPEADQYSQVQCTDCHHALLNRMGPTFLHFQPAVLCCRVFLCSELGWSGVKELCRQALAKCH